METLAVKLDLFEVQALLEIVDTELFRIKFIDTKFPGHKANPARLKLATSAIKSLRDVFTTAKGFNVPAALAPADRTLQEVRS